MRVRIAKHTDGGAVCSAPPANTAAFLRDDDEILAEAGRAGSTGDATTSLLWPNLVMNVRAGETVY